VSSLNEAATGIGAHANRIAHFGTANFDTANFDTANFGTANFDTALARLESESFAKSFTGPHSPA